MRRYDRSLVSKIREETVNVDGVDIIFKRIPDDDRKGVMDPRVLQIARNKLKMFTERARSGFKLSNERYRPDKVTYDLCETEVDEKEMLIKIADHMIDLFIFRSADVEGKTPVLIYLHGGGFTAGDIHLFRNQMRYVAELSKATVIFPEYRLAPECPYPGQIIDAMGTIEYVVDHADELDVDADKLMVAGDSAGGSLTNSCLLKDDKGYIKKVFEIYPACDNTSLNELKDYKWSYDMYDIDGSQAVEIHSRIDRIKKGYEKDKTFDLYVQNGEDRNDPLLAICKASDESLKKLPPMVIASSEYDFLRVGSDYFVKRMKGLDKDVKSIRYCGCDHGIFDLIGTLPQAEDLCMELAKELKSLY